MTPNITATLAAIVVIQFVYIVMQHLKMRKWLKNYIPLLGILEAFRVVCFNSATSDRGKGIVPKKIWSECQKAVKLTMHINTKGILRGGK